jgi:hypothetical protein
LISALVKVNPAAFAALAPHTLAPSAAIQIPNLFTTYLSFDEIGIFYLVPLMSAIALSG